MTITANPSSVTAKRHTPAGEALTRLILEAFAFNGALLAAGDRLTRDLGLTSARWQVLGAIADGPLPVAQIARNMGLTRQAVQRLANELAAAGFVAYAANPNHQRAKLVGLTERGRRDFDAVSARQRAWANTLADRLDPAQIEAAAALIATLRQRLSTDRPDDERLDSDGH